MASPLITIVGETASGKSELALYLATKFSGEIINADSWSVYVDFNIGTAKPSISDRSKIKHYLIDVADPKIGFSAAEFKKQASKAIFEINNNNKVPILVGGTGLYIDSILYDYSFLPPSSVEDRLKYEAMTLNQLQELCIEKGYSLSSIDKNNKRRVTRLLENEGIFPTSMPMREDTLVLGIRTAPNLQKKNIETRTRKMLENGLEDEVRNLAKEYGWGIEPMKGIGYREFKDFFDKKISLDELAEKINADTLKLVKKQKTWFKRNKSIQWYSNRDDIVDVVTSFVNKYN